MRMCLFFLTCANDKEADKIVDILLKKHLVVCTKKTKVSSKFLWKGKIDKSDEVLVVMDSIEENFEKIEQEVRKIHSYNTFVLLSNPVTKASKGIEEWMKEEIQK